MREPLTLALLAPQLERLNAVFTKYGMADMKTLAAGYFDALRDLDAEAVKEAVGLAIKQEPRFPVPAKLRELAREWIARSRISLLPAPTPNAEGDGVVCKVCGSRVREAWLQGRTAKQNVRYEEQETWEFKRYIAPCNPNKHPVGSGYVPMPENFLGWVEEGA